MYKKVLISGVTAAAILGAGGTAFALTGSNTTSGTPSTPGSSSTATHAKKDGKKGDHGKKDLLRRMEYGQFVTGGKDGKTVTHDLIKGTVTSVSSSSITVSAKDKKSETFAVTSATKVRVRQDGKGADSSISSVSNGDRVLVVGTGSSSYTATHVVDVKGKK